jgi:GTPase SAR1 family protein
VTLENDPIEQALARCSNGLSKAAEELGLATLAAQIQADAARRLHSGRLRVLVLGEIKHGKSSLINALVGDALLPIGVTPTTGAIVTVRPEGGAGRYLVDASGERTPVEDERFSRLARGQDRAADRWLLATFDPGRIPADIELIDTPGLNDIDRFRSAIGRGELPRADVLILVLDATQVLTRTELATIRDAIAAVGGLDGSGATLELVINRIDLVAERDRPALVEHVCGQLADVVPGPALPFQTDARGALREPSSSAFGVREVERLRGRLRELAGQRDHILPARMRSSLLRYERVLSYNAAIQARALTLDEDTLAAEVEAVEKALRGTRVDLEQLRSLIAQGRDRVLRDSHARIGRFVTELDAATLSQIDRADLRALTDVLPGALQDAFMDFTRQETESLRGDLDALTHEVLRTHGEQARRRLFEATLRLGFRGPRVYVEPPSVVIEAGMIALGVLGTAIMYFGNLMTGLVMTIASPLTTMILREKSVRDARVRARKLFPEAMATTRETLEQTIDGIVRDHARALDEHVTISSQALGEQLAATLERARAQLRDDESREQARAQLSELEHRLGRLRATLEALDVGARYEFDDFETPTVIH